MSVMGPTRVYMLNFFHSSIQLHILLSLYLCFISFLYLDLHLLGDVKNKGDVGAFKTYLSPPVKLFFTDRSKAVLLLWILYFIGVALTTQVAHVRNKNSIIQGRSLNVIKVIFHIIRN